MTLLIVLPLLIPLLTAALLLALGRWRRAQGWGGVAGAALLLAAGVALLDRVSREGIQATPMGAWPAPFGIVLVADLFSAVMVVVAGIIGLCVAVFSLANVGRRHWSFGYFPLVHLLLAGVCGAFLTGDIFNLYVWFEVLLIASFVLLALGGGRAQMEGALKYVALNLVSSALFLVGAGLLYGMAGTLNLADIPGKLGSSGDPGLTAAVAALFLSAFSIKAATFPFFFWLPASYHTPPAAVSALFAGLLTKVGVYALIRVFTLVFPPEAGHPHALILALSGATMVTGVLGAVAQGEFRRVLSFHIISQIGYMTLGLGLYTPLALGGSIFYIVHHIIVKTNLFLVGGVVQRLHGTSRLKALGGLHGSRPLLGVLFLVPALSLGGVPPLSGFFAKLSLAMAGLSAGQHAIVAVALAVGLLTLFSMTKLWAEAFWKPAPPAPPPPPPGRREMVPLLAPIVGLAALTVVLGLAAEPFLALSLRAAEQLMDPSEYIAAVLGAP
ncbi:MAG: Na+/H+ antiporter subunit D [Halobacteria archaeon]